MNKKMLISLLLTGTLLLSTGSVLAEELQPDDIGSTDSPSGESQEIITDFASEEEMISSMKPAAENSRFQMYYNEKTMAIALRDKISGKVVTSNPYNAAQDSHYNGDTEKELESQLVLTYVDNQNNKSSLWSSTDCAELGQFQVKEVKDGVDFSLSIGKEKADFQIPAAFTVSRFDELVSKMEKRAQRKMNVFYTLYSLADIVDEQERKELLTVYPLLAEQDLYVCIELSDREKEDLIGYLEETGYTAEDYKADMEQLKITETEDSSTVPNFKLDLEYRLTDDGLCVTIPNNSIEYDKANYTLISIQVLEYFGAEKPGSQNDGYLFLPDGSGAILSMTNPDENRRPVISGNVYGRDAAVTQKVDERAGQQFYLPVFGIRRSNQTAVFAIIESGAEVSTISAKLAHPNSDYYAAYNTFYLTTSELVTLDAKVASIGSAQKVYVYDKNAYKKDFKISYAVFDGEQASYYHMAQYYRQYLLNHGMKENAESNRLQMGLETLGTSLYATSFLGLDIQMNAGYTSYLKTRDMAEYFLQNGVKRLQLTLTGWQKNGLDTGISNKVKLSGSLGGKKDFKTLGKWAADNNISVYPDADLLFVSNDSWFDGFNKAFDAGKTLSKKYAGNSVYQPDISQFGKKALAISPHKYERYWSGFFKDCKKLDISSVSLGTVGEFLNSNFDNAKSYNRGDTLELITKQLETYGKQLDFSFDGANAYVLPYASALNRVPIQHSGYTGETAAVPFLQLVVAGSMTYQSDAVNLGEDVQTTLLRCIESRTSPLFTLAAEHIERFKTTSHTRYYAVSFEVLKGKTLQQYQYVADALASVEGQSITGHSIPVPGVACTTYENGTRIYVNYNETLYQADGVSVDPQSYTVLS